MIPDIPFEQCPETMGQIQKLLFQRVSNKPIFSSDKSPELKASWTPLITASDETKVVVSPWIENPELAPGDARTFGGGNATLNGVEVVVGSEATSFTGLIRKQPQKVIKALKKLMCEPLSVYFVDEYGRIWMLEKKKGEYNGVPIQANTIFVGDKAGGNLEEPDSNTISFKLAPNWSDDLVPISPEDFNALEELHKEEE